jgi:tetratricopeptide (TPR) repeat protein
MMIRSAIKRETLNIFWAKTVCTHKCIMYKFRNIVFVAMALFFIQNKAFSNPTDKFYQFYISGNMVGWQNHLNELKLACHQSNSGDQLETIVFAQYGLIGYYLGRKEKELAQKELEQAQLYLDLLVKTHPEKQKYKALQGAFIGFELGISPWKAMILGPESQEIIIHALKKAPNEAQTNFEYANMRFWAPAIVGGNKTEALIFYKKTIELLETQKQTHHWFYLWALTAYANALNKTEQANAANQVYQKILKIEPNYEWVAKELSKNKNNLPDLDF